MTEFDQIKAGLLDAIEHKQGGDFKGRVSEVAVSRVDVVGLRKRLGMSQKRFSETYGFPKSTLQKWEQGTRHPTGAARVLLRVLDREPMAVKKALEQA